MSAKSDPLARFALAALIAFSLPAAVRAQDVDCDQPNEREVRSLRFEGNRTFDESQLSAIVITTPSSFARRYFRIFGTKRCFPSDGLAQDVAKRMAKKMDGVPQSGLVEVLLNRASTAHILGGFPIGMSSDTGVVDPKGKVFGYDDLYVVDGSIIPANLGVNPSLTITAMAEHVMSHVPAKLGAALPAPAPVPVLPASRHADTLHFDD